MHCTQCGQALAADEQFCPVCGAPRETTGMTFAQAEQEYFRLRGQLDTRRLTPEQFESALRNLMVTDAQGRYWMLGVDSGVWYVHNGQQWVRADPTPLNVPASRSTNSALYVILGVLVLALLSLLAVVGYWFVQSGNRRLPLIQSSTNDTTPVTGLAVAATHTPIPTLAPAVAPPGNPTADPESAVPAANGRPTVPQGTVSQASARPTVPQETAPSALTVPAVSQETAPPETALTPIAMPGATVVVVIEEGTATVLRPTDAPSLAPPTVELTRTRVPPTRTAAPTETLAPTLAPTPAYPPGVYVTQISTEPAEPKRNQGVTFLVTFVNTTGATQQYNWLIQIYDANNNKRFGETQVKPLTVPPGTSTQTSPNNWRVTGAGGCVPFYAQAQFQNADGGRIPFSLPDGNTFSQGFSVCP